ncbi:MAG: DUF4215 domain-containing protein [bacterium]
MYPATRTYAIATFPRLLSAVALLLCAGCLVSFGHTAGGGDGAVTDAAQDAAAPDAALHDASMTDGAPPDVGWQDAALTCGDGVVNPGEQCDDGINNSDTAVDACRNNCRLPWCGDGVIDTGEQCDNGPSNSDILPNACRTSCVNARCGDGVNDTGEQCDDGNNTDTDACRISCVLATCGDGVVWSGQEECDDGNQTNGDGCSQGCTVESLPGLRWLTNVSQGWSQPWVMTYANQPYAPVSTVTAAVAIESLHRAIIFTQSTYHVLNVTQQIWIISGPTSDLPSLPASGPNAGYGLAQGSAQEYVTLLVDHYAYGYVYNHTTHSFALDLINDIDTNQDWSTPEAPAPGQVTAMWIDLSNGHQWTQTTVYAACGAGPSVTIGPHGVSLTSSTLHLQDAGYCFDFYDDMPTTSFPPFGPGVANAPSPGEIRGAFYFDDTDTLFVITQQ